MTREEIYDTEIAPLMTKIIEVCQEHDIPLVASFQLEDERGDEEELFCTTLLQPKDAHDNIKRAGAILHQEPAAWGAFVTTTDENGAESTEQVAGSNMPEDNNG